MSYIDFNMRVGTEFLVTKSIPRDYEKLQNFIDGVTQDLIEKVQSMDDRVLSSEVKKNVVEKLNNTVFFTIDSLDLEDFYKELNLNGTENLVRSLLGIKKFKKRIEIYRPKWPRYLERALRYVAVIIGGVESKMLRNE